MISAMTLAVLLSATGPGHFELGIILGEPSGICLKNWFDTRTAVDAAVSWSLRDDDEDLYLHADFLWHDFDLIHSSEMMPVYYGIGGRVVLATDTKLGARVPIGISWLLDGAPLDLFIELAAVVDVVPEVELDFNGGIGIRFIF